MMSVNSFIEKISPAAVQEMHDHRIPASLIIAQGICESRSGDSLLASKYNNLFGIKAGSSWAGNKVSLKTKEFVNGKYITVYSYFRVYSSWTDSIKDHTQLLLSPRYKNIVGTDYKTACILIKQDGYATSPTYTQTLISIIEKYKLYEYDAAPVQPVYYTVVKGDCMSKIASKNHIPLKTLLALNPNVKPPKYVIYPGNKIRIK